VTTAVETEPNGEEKRKKVPEFHSNFPRQPKLEEKATKTEKAFGEDIRFFPFLF
jgi:hypothetical protein